MEQRVGAACWSSVLEQRVVQRDVQRVVQRVGAACYCWWIVVVITVVDCGLQKF